MGSIDYVSWLSVEVNNNYNCYYRSGPTDSPFEDGVFVAELLFPQDYPLSPPKMKFLSDMFHPNGTELQFQV